MEVVLISACPCADLLASLYPAWRAARSIRWRRSAMSDAPVLELKGIQQSFKEAGGDVSTSSNPPSWRSIPAKWSR
jgi:hypothetical protein